ncbi:MAG TPA: V-type ATP synthase subunit C [Lachnospiraceae bacterium]|nr:V-type ATP synthase subunit C [Lachnospiraceae bacterium]
MAEQYIYAVARVRSRELSLLNESVIGQLCAASGEEDCLRILNEKGWGNPDLPGEEMFREEQKKTWSFIRELVPDRMQVFDVFRLAADYHNLKAAVKESCIDGTHPGIYQEDGTLDSHMLETALAESDYEALPRPMRQVAQEAKEMLLQTRDGQLCDAMIDKAALEAIREAGASTGEKLLADYGELICATGDIKIAVRCAKCGKDRSFLMKALAPCRSLDIELLADAAASGTDAVIAYLDHTDYADAVDELKNSVASFERWCDNRMIETIRPEIHNPFGIGPIAAYILARENEIRTVRIILAAKRNHLPEEMLRERVRVMYV